MQPSGEPGGFIELSIKWKCPYNILPDPPPPPPSSHLTPPVRTASSKQKPPPQPAGHTPKQKEPEIVQFKNSLPPLRNETEVTSIKSGPSVPAFSTGSRDTHVTQTEASYTQAALKMNPSKMNGGSDVSVTDSSSEHTASNTQVHSQPMVIRVTEPASTTTTTTSSKTVTTAEKLATSHPAGLKPVTVTGQTTSDQPKASVQLPSQSATLKAVVEKTSSPTGTLKATSSANEAAFSPSPPAGPKPGSLAQPNLKKAAKGLGGEEVTPVSSAVGVSLTVGTGGGSGSMSMVSVTDMSESLQSVEEELEGDVTGDLTEEDHTVTPSRDGDDEEGDDDDDDDTMFEDSGKATLSTH